MQIRKHSRSKQLQQALHSILRERYVDGECSNVSAESCRTPSAMRDLWCCRDREMEVLGEETQTGRGELELVLRRRNRVSVSHNQEGTQWMPTRSSSLSVVASRAIRAAASSKLSPRATHCGYRSSGSLAPADQITLIGQSKPSEGSFGRFSRLMEVGDGFQRLRRRSSRLVQATAVVIVATLKYGLACASCRTTEAIHCEKTDA